MKLPRFRMGPHEDVRGWGRGLVVAVIAGVFLTFSGAFDTSAVSLPARFGYWMLMMVVGYFVGSFISQWFFGSGKRRTGNIWLDAALAAVVIAAPFTFVVWFATRALLGSQIAVSGIPVLFGYVLLVSLALTTINLLIETRRVAITGASPTPPKFLERLPLKLRGAEVWAVEAEDHYLRLHTSKGQDLILMRLADAVAELEGIEGAQVHRSWWIARDAITDAKRGDGRATLTLKDGAEVPVSRTYAGPLREKGWI